MIIVFRVSSVQYIYVNWSSECPVDGCGSVRDNNTSMMMHFTRVHKNDPNKKFHDVRCFFLECTHHSFNSVSSLYNHLRADHPEFKTSTHATRQVLLDNISLYYYNFLFTYLLFAYHIHCRYTTNFQILKAVPSKLNH